MACSIDGNLEYVGPPPLAAAIMDPVLNKLLAKASHAATTTTPPALLLAQLRAEGGAPTAQVDPSDRGPSSLATRAASSRSPRARY